MRIPTMIPLEGVTEIVGEPGVGKSIFALSLCNYFSDGDNLNTIYLSHNQIKFKKIPQNVIIKRIETLLDLRICVTHEIEYLMKQFKIKLIVIDDFEDYLYVQDSPRKQANEIFQIIRILKKLCFVKGSNIVIINKTYKYSDVIKLDIEVKNRYFGLPWEYLINSRYIFRKIDDCRIIEAFNINKKYVFTINNNGAAISN